jgi:pimeloyl-ACP methyl ester carboxylesterase
MRNHVWKFALALIGAVMFAPLSAVAARTPIDRSLFIPAGGIDQWISIKGDDRANPVLLVVHGGPGEAQWPEAEKYRPWEHAFTVVQWDQRGAGHTYGRYGKNTPDLNLERLTKDGIEVAGYLRRTLGKKKIIVLGHSWGSIVAVQMAQRRPDLFAAYVGTGQVESWKATVGMQFDVVLAKARRDGDEAMIKELEAIGRPDPSDTKLFFHVTRNYLDAMAPPDREWIKSLRANLPAMKAADPKNFQDFLDGFGYSAEHLLPDQVATDLAATATKFDTAFFVIQGRDDLITPTKAAADYFDRVRAPEKEMILIPDAGHFAYMTAPDAFLAALTDKVRPAAIRRGA